MHPLREQFVDQAEALVRHDGYAGFSLEAVAASLNQPLDSLLTHFPNRDHLARAVAERWSERSLLELGPPLEGATQADVIRHLISHFHGILLTAGSLSLCSGLRNSLPAEVGGVSRAFKLQVQTWLTQSLLNAGTGSLPHCRKRAESILSALGQALDLLDEPGSGSLADDVHAFLRKLDESN